MTSRQESVHLSPVNRQAYAVARDSTITAALLMLLLLGMTNKTLTTATTLSVTRFQHWSTNYRISVCPSACLCAWIWRWTSAPHPVILFRVILWWVVSIERSACSVMVNKRTKSINNAPRATAPNVMGKFKWQLEWCTLHFNSSLQRLIRQHDVVVWSSWILFRIYLQFNTI